MVALKIKRIIHAVAFAKILSNKSVQTQPKRKQKFPKSFVITIIFLDIEYTNIFHIMPFMIKYKA